MKIANRKILDESLEALIDNINAELDWDAIEKLLLEKHNFAITEQVDYKSGNLVVYNNSIAYRFDFDVKVPLSVFFNKSGECLEISASKDDPAPGASPADPSEKTGSSEAHRNAGNVSDPETVSNIADMISEINREG